MRHGFESTSCEPIRELSAPPPHAQERLTAMRLSPAGKRWIGGLLKYLWLLIAAVPLLSIAGAELVRLVQATSVQREAVYFDEAAAAREKLKGTKGTGFLRQTDLVGPFVTIAPNATVLKTGLTPSNQTLASAVERHSLTVGDTWKLFAEYARLRRGDPLPESPPFPVSHPYHAPWHERFVVVDLESRLDTLRRERPADVQEARDLLNRYRVLPAHDAAFMMLMTADIEGYELRFLKGLDLHALLVNYFKNAADDQVSLETLNRLQERFENLDSYGRRYESPDDHVVWVRQEALRCGLTRDLIRADQTVQNLPLDRRIAELGRFVTAAGATEQSITVVQQTVRTLCAVQLEPELPLDGSLYVLRHDEDADEITLVPRADVIVVWEDRSFQWLAETGFDEYSLPVEKVHRLIVPSRGTRPALLRPTKKSQAVHTYNRNRRDMPWTPQALSVLRNACQPHANELGDVWQRVVELHELAMRHGELFPQPKERKE